MNRKRFRVVFKALNGIRMSLIISALNEAEAVTKVRRSHEAHTVYSVTQLAR